VLVGFSFVGFPLQSVIDFIFPRLVVGGPVDFLQYFSLQRSVLVWQCPYVNDSHWGCELMAYPVDGLADKVGESGQ